MGRDDELSDEKLQTIPRSSEFDKLVPTVLVA